MQKCGLDLAFDLVSAEQGNVVGVEPDAFLVARHDLVDELRGLGERFLTVDEHLADILTQIVTDRAENDVVLLVDQGGRLLFLAGVADRFPQLQQVVEVPLQLLCASPDARRADDDAHPVGYFKAAQGFAQLFAVLAFYPAGDATRPRIVGHEHHVPTGQAQERRQCGALVAAFFLVHLDEELLAGGDQVGDAGRSRAVAGLPVGLGCPVGFGEELPRYFLGGKKAVSFGAELDECGPEARLYAGDPRLIDVPFLLFAPVTLDVEVIQALSRPRERRAPLRVASR